jgi:hypothetical protein
VVFDEKNIPFFENGFIVYDDRVEWEMMIRKDFADALKITLPETFTFIPEAAALCTNVDIGEIGEFDPKVFEALPAYARSKGYSIRENEPMRGILLGRGYDDGRFHRIVRLNLPIQI